MGSDHADLAHRSFFRVRADPALVTTVRTQLRSWLDARQWTDAEPTDGSLVDLAPGVSCSSVRVVDGDAGVTERHRLVDRAVGRPESDTSVIELTVRRDGVGDGWVWTDLYGPVDRDHAAPTLAQEILRGVVGCDGDHPLTPTVRFAGPSEIETILAMLHDRRRRGPLYLAGSSELRRPSGDIPLSRWQDYAERVLGGTHGAASGFVLDHATTDVLNARLPRSHRLAPWTLRTYLPRVDVDDPDDGLRHRFLTTARIVNSDVRTLRPTFTRNARLTTLTTPLPAEAIELDQHLRTRLVERDRRPFEHA